MADAYDYLLKFLLVGGPRSGKSSIISKFSQDLFPSEYVCTIGIDFNIRTMNIDGKSVKLQIWDTAGDEKFRAITSAYYRGATVRRSMYMWTVVYFTILCVFA
jgi:Ras-related protein Rab-1A